MPGIFGIISRSPNKKFSALVNAMAEIMAHENFYKSGIRLFPEMGVHCGWTILENSFAENGIFFNEDKSVVLIFCGECFLDPNAGAELKAKEHLVSENKADWLPHLYEEQGDSFFEKLNGLFSGLLIDRRRQKAFLFNDRYGIQRIYFHQSDDAFYFASEAKALLGILPESRKFNADGVAEFLAFGCTLNWKTIFHGIEMLPGGSLCTFENGECRKTKYFSPETWESQPQLPEDEFEEKFQEIFKRILPRYFETGSKLGIALTGGLDTRMIMACRPENSPRPVCYTFSGNDGKTLDDKIAALVASACGMNHHLLRLGENFFSDFAAHADKTVYITDGCFGITGAHEIYFNHLARQLAPTRLTGNYGSEVFRGISTFKPIPVDSRIFSAQMREQINSLPESPANERNDPMTFAVFKEIPWNLFGSLAAGRSQVQFRTPYLDNEIVALAYQSPLHIRKSSLPATRLVKNNCRALSEIPTDRGFTGDNSGLRFLFRRFFAEITFKLDYYNNEGLPDFLASFDSVFQRVAAGFGILGMHKFLHYRSWFRKKLSSFVRERLSSNSVLQSDFWDAAFVEQIADEHIRGRKNFSLEINSILSLESIERQFFYEMPAARTVENFSEPIPFAIENVKTIPTGKRILWA